MKYIMLKLQEILQKKCSLFKLKNPFGCTLKKQINKNSLHPNYQITTKPNPVLTSTEISTEKQILDLLKFKNKFLSENEILGYLSATINEEKFCQKKIIFCLEKLEKEKRIYEYRIPKTNKSLWGQAYWLDQNMLPKKAYINNQKYRDAIREYKRQCNLA
ncbi:MAG: hypothetical protein LBE92_01045 [Chryseobacterium sp.]|jgi:hypothetical protein|uniref:hypothetical protein n=1 Tax=Chryseobacterium sp. TaxID=1871047 RepID=UPI0028191CF9|nr:hypothetical protein [Chryseobacterium sp.]MDR2234685.1 hypothetical protein [Chryseobacterium sp.]